MIKNESVENLVGSKSPKLNQVDTIKPVDIKEEENYTIAKQVVTN
jgi:hypothetical protein